MKCFYCDMEASAKIGGSKGNILAALLPFLHKDCWRKKEIYVCSKCFKRIID
ncbi:MAG: hypothetical protein ACTSXD_08465 [Candidatus Heimdallarchaeaceae archaeon]